MVVFVWWEEVKCRESERSNQGGFAAALVRVAERDDGNECEFTQLEVVMNLSLVISFSWLLASEDATLRDSVEGEAMSIEDVKDESGVHGGCKGVKTEAGTDSTKALFDSKTC
ncbi:hypothetical protein V8G54_024375 [Vigna mungo]|uniref:Uncharacterized protein n=1 Tax=Vigna mungo TaxID=3915 RepID=A0AAQ3N5T2_VIGMU